MKKHLIVFSLLSLSVVGCQSLYPPTTNPDYTIRVVKTEDGTTAIPPICPSWTTDGTNPFEEQPLPQFGCAHARNLALMVENPNDLVEPQNLGPARGSVMIGSVRRYDNNQTRSLIVTGAESNQAAASTMSTTTSAITGDSPVASGGSSSASTPPSSSGP